MVFLCLLSLTTWAQLGTNELNRSPEDDCFEDLGGNRGVLILSEHKDLVISVVNKAYPTTVDLRGKGADGNYRYYVIVDVREKTVLCDYFVIAGGRSTTQVKALCDNLEEKLSKEGVEPRRVEGVKEGRWGVLDYGDVIVHIFNDESRLFYHLERLWGEGDNVRRYE